MEQPLCIIPARGGSKRIPRKNIKAFLGRPIIAYSVDAALKSDLFSDVMVSTDDEEIADVARSCGASVPFLRSPANSTDFSGTVDVLLEVLNRYAEQGSVYSVLCCLYPTAPFVTQNRLREAHRLLEESAADAVIPVVRFGYPIQRSLRLSGDRVGMFWPEHYSSRSQDLEPAYHDAGQFYWLRSAALRSGNRVYGHNAVAVVVPESEVQDIDNDEDWKLAEWKMKWRQSQQSV